MLFAELGLSIYRLIRDAGVDVEKAKAAADAAMKEAFGSKIDTSPLHREIRDAEGYSDEGGE